MSGDAFATLGLSRRAALTEEEIQAAYFSRSKEEGLDQEELNAAFQTLSAPEKRLKHLLEFAGSPETKAWRAVVMPEDLMRLFSKVGTLKAESESLLKRRAAAGSALAKALLEPQVLKLREAGEEIATQLSAELDALVQTFPELDHDIAAGADGAWMRVAVCQAHLAYLTKWQAQVRELLLGLM